MKYIGWEKREAPRKQESLPLEDRDKIIEIYVFNNPKIRKYDGNVIGLGALGNDCVFYEIRENVLKKKNTGAGMSKGFQKDCFCEVNGDIKRLSEKIGVDRKHLEKIISFI